jgi:hypothetical protein
MMLQHQFKQKYKTKKKKKKKGKEEKLEGICTFQKVMYSRRNYLKNRIKLKY